MDVLDAIRKRRSVRSFESKSIARETIQEILEAGNWAATGLNQQPWRFVVVQDPTFISRLLEQAGSKWRRTVERKAGTADQPTRKYLVDMFARSFRWPAAGFETMMSMYVRMDDGVFYGAPAIVFVIGADKGTRNPDCAMVCQNIMLAAYSFGLGSCWVGSGARITDGPEIVAELDLKDGEKIFGPIAIGYPKGGFPDPPQKRPPRVKWI